MTGCSGADPSPRSRSSAPARAGSRWASGSSAAGYDFTIYEKSDGVGGTWRDNDYPGAACDVPSHLYSFSFELNPWWSRTYATQPEILAYLERCTDQYGVRPHVRTGVAITTATWDDRAQHWELDDRDRRDRSRADVRGERTRHAERSRRPRHPGRRPVPRPLVPLVALGPQQVRRRRAGRVDRHRCERDPVRPRDRAGSRAPHGVPTLADLDHAADRPGLHRGGAAAVRARPGAARRHRWKIWWTYERANFQTDERTDRNADRARAVVPRAQDRRPGAAGEAHARLSRRLQAAADLTRMVPGVDARQRARRHRTDRRDHRQPASAPPTAKNTRSTRSSTAPASAPTST